MGGAVIAVHLAAHELGAVVGLHVDDLAVGRTIGQLARQLGQRRRDLRGFRAAELGQALAGGVQGQDQGPTGQNTSAGPSAILGGLFT